MARTPKPSKESMPRWRQFRHWRPAAAVLITLMLVCGILLAIDRFGSEALSRIGSRDRYRTAFNNIECDSPPGMDPHQFLAEVRYVSGFSETFHALEEGDREKLVQAFAMHPRVEEVKAISVEAGGIVAVRLSFRLPVLAVRVDRGAVRLVDAHGFLLPESEPPRGIAELMNIVPGPTSAAGELWHNETVRRAIDLAMAYQPRSLELTDKEWRLIQTDGKTLTVAK